MVRDSNRIYAEANDPDTVLAVNKLSLNKLVVGASNKDVVQYNSANKLLALSSNGELTGISLVANKTLGTDDNGNLVFK